VSIFGTAYLDGRPDPARSAVSQAQALSHRDQGEPVIVDGRTVALGLRRRRGDQGSAPARPHPSGIHVVYEGRLDNREDLGRALGRDRLEAAASDAEIVRQAYLDWGERCVERLLGDFALVLWDPRQARLFCARDQFGVVPLFYLHEPGQRFAWASEVQALLCLPDVDDSLDDEALAESFLVALRPGARTFHRAVRRLEPAHALTVERDRVNDVVYWHPDAVLRRDGPWEASDRDYEEAYRSTLEQAVRDRIAPVGRSGVGAHLSGGLDSSAVAVLAGRALARRGATLTTTAFVRPESDRHLGPDGTPEIEAVLAAERGTSRLESFRISGERCWEGRIRPVLRDRPTLLPCGDQESEDRALFRARGVSLVLSGWGGDEVSTFNGRGYPAQLLRAGRLAALWRLSGGAPGLRHRAAYVRAQAWRPLVRSVRSQWPAQNDARLASLLPHLNTEWAQELRAAERIETNRLSRRTLVDAHASRVELVTSGHLGRRCEIWDLWGAHHGITYCYPLLDRRLVELCLRIPVSQWVRPGENRSLHRRAMRGVLPDRVRLHPGKSPTIYGDARRMVRDRTALQDELDALASVPSVTDRFRLSVARTMLAAVPGEGILADPVSGEVAERDLSGLAGVVRRVVRHAELVARHASRDWDSTAGPGHLAAGRRASGPPLRTLLRTDQEPT
jgi:asparagine synthase (glutamine-hydrolysing)